MASGHIVASFDEDLGELNTMLTRLGGLAEKQFADAMDALERRDIQNIDEIIARDAELDEMEFNLNERGIEIIALRAPVARDLQRVIVTIKVAAVLERIGDYAKNIAKRSRVIIEHENSKSDNVSLARMAALVQQMLNQVLDAYVSKDMIWLWMCATVTWKLTACTSLFRKYWRACPRPRSRSLPDRICFYRQKY